jgi:calcineurin-like phosphoesterase family protein
VASGLAALFAVNPDRIRRAGGRCGAETPARLAAILGVVKVRFGAALVGAILLTAPAAAAQPRVKLSRAVAEPGDRVVVAGHGFPRTARLRIALAGRTLRRARTGPRGGFRLAFRVPERAAGTYRLKVSARGRWVRRRFRIRALPDPPPPDPTPAAAQTPPEPPPQPPAPPTLVAAGDIACPPELSESPTACRHARTADLVGSLAPDAVAVLGDNQYEHGQLANFEAVFDPTWGRFKAITHPAVGNHEYEGDPERDDASGYFDYFGAAAGDPSKGYYRWALGDWTVFVLNSGAIQYTRTGGGAAEPDDCWPVSCAEGSEQEQWLRAELATLPAGSCVLAYWHHPRFSSGFGGAHQPHPETAPLFDALHDHGAALVLTGHSHNYERFWPSDAAGTADPEGVTQFVVGTGGRNLHTNTGAPMTTTLRTDVFGVLELTLGATGWSARFVAEDSSSLDQAAGGC